MPACSASASSPVRPATAPASTSTTRRTRLFWRSTGRWEIQWGDKGEQKTVLEPFDLIAVPPRVTRRFVNVAEEDAHLLVIIQGRLEDFDDVDRVPETAAAIAQKFGPGMVRTLERLGWKFTIGAEEKAGAAG